jgi:outer membrane lipoprotein-sorting protein
MVLLPRRRSAIFFFAAAWLTLLLCIGTLTACSGSGNSSTQPTARPRPTPTPTPDPGQQILASLNNKLKNAKTLHGVFNLTIDGQTFSGTSNMEIWNSSPDKSRVEAHQSTIPQFASGSIIVTDGQTLWQYDPDKNIVYTGAAPKNTNGTTGSNLGGTGNGQGTMLLNLVQSIFSQSKGIMHGSSQVAGHNVYDVAITPQSSSAATDTSGSTNSALNIGSLNYTGDVFVDKQSNLPVQVILTLQGFGKVQLDIPTLEINPTIPASTFTFAIPSGAQVEPLQQATPTPDGSSLTFVQAQRQAGYHLLSISSDQTDYVLNGVAALGSPGNETFTLNYMKGNLSFTIVEGKSLANLPPGSGSKQVQVRNTSGSFMNRNGTTTLAWTEQGVGLQITGQLSEDQAVAISGLLS